MTTLLANIAFTALFFGWLVLSVAVWGGIGVLVHRYTYRTCPWITYVAAVLLVGVPVTAGGALSLWPIFAAWTGVPA